MKIVLGWILFLWGCGGIVMNLRTVIFFGLDGMDSMVLVLNTVVCILFIWLGWRFRTKRQVQA